MIANIYLCIALQNFLSQFWMINNDFLLSHVLDAAMHNENWEERGNGDLNMTIPLLMQNKVPEGTETDDKLDVSIRPDEVRSLRKMSKVFPSLCHQPSNPLRPCNFASDQLFSSLFSTSHI